MEDPDYGTLIEAFNLDDGFDYLEYLRSFGDPVPFTIFAPTNDAFDALLVELEVESLAEIPNDDLAAILKYHVIPKTNFDVISEDRILTTLKTGEILVRHDPVEYNYEIDENNRGGNLYSGLSANNGIIYKVDKCYYLNYNQYKDR